MDFKSIFREIFQIKFSLKFKETSKQLPQIIQLFNSEKFQQDLNEVIFDSLNNVAASLVINQELSNQNKTQHITHSTQGTNSTSKIFNGVGHLDTNKPIKVFSETKLIQNPRSYKKSYCRENDYFPKSPAKISKSFLVGSNLKPSLNTQSNSIVKSNSFIKKENSNFNSFSRQKSKKENRRQYSSGTAQKDSFQNILLNQIFQSDPQDQSQEVYNQNGQDYSSKKSEINPFNNSAENLNQKIEPINDFICEQEKNKISNFYQQTQTSNIFEPLGSIVEEKQENSRGSQEDLSSVDFDKSSEKIRQDKEIEIKMAKRNQRQKYVRRESFTKSGGLLFMFQMAECQSPKFD